MDIRPMLEADADAVRRVDMLAFSPLFIKTGLPRDAAGEFPLRTRENILAALAIFPAGCFVADAGEELAGYIFARVWGSVGWVGVFGIHPEYQGQRVGQRLLDASVEALWRAGCQLIGLETIPDSYYNIGLYTRKGFRPITMTFALQKDVQSGLSSAECRALSAQDEHGLAEVSRISRAAWDLLDLRAEAAYALEYGWGQVVLVGSAAPYAAAVVRVANRRENTANTLYEVSALAGLPDSRARLPQLAQALERFAAQQGFAQLRLILNSADWESMHTLSGLGYRVVHSAVRMILTGHYGAHPGLEFSRWAM
jgi:ribosomal protein S18 acetylase RimI-like enzyme